MLQLNNITIVCCDNQTTDLLVYSLQKTLQRIRPKEIFIWSRCWNEKDNYIFNDVPFKIFPSQHETKFECGKVYWDQMPNCVTTSHVLCVEWDSWVLNESKWTDEFLNFDYIGAVWPWHQNFRIGNGGFCLRSMKLMRFLQQNQNEFPYPEKEDDTLCRVYRPGLEKLGFKWPGETLTNQFAFERGKKSDTFGFHGLYNFPSVLSKNEFNFLFSKLNNYIKEKSEYLELLKNSCVLGLFSAEQLPWQA